VTPSDIVVNTQRLRFYGRQFPCSIGRGGVRADKQEGDHATPSGIHRLAGIYYRPDKLASPSPIAVPLRIGDMWSDDVNDPHYNAFVRPPHHFSHETLRRPDPLYDIIIVTDWNRPSAIPGRGSAIFVHQWRRCRFPTEGCVALRRDHLFWIVQRIRDTTRLIVM